MLSKTLHFALCASILATACGDEEPNRPSGTFQPDSGPGAQPSGNDAGTVAQPDAAVAQTDADVPPVLTGDSGTAVFADAAVAIPEGKCDYKDQAVSLTSDLVIPAGSIVRVCEGVTFTASAKAIKVQVNGTLVVAGTTDKPAKFVGTAATPDSWAGIVLNAGGDLRMTNGTVSGAHFALHALAGSHYVVDYAEFSASFKAAVVEADGTFDHTKFLAGDVPGFKLTSQVDAEDINGTFTVLGSSPTVTNSLFVGSPSKNIDVVRVGDNAAPTFDHVRVRDAHCGFHTNDSKVSGGAPRITNSIIENHEYGLMAYNGNATFENNVFRGNTNDFGFCFGTTSANAPVLHNNYYPAGAPKIEPASCNGLVSERQPAQSEPAGVGPVGL